ncbi:MAG: hypothetical protein HN341_17240 [Verrucomicrobia bacterium]|jgi:hypothetical protein|nr:hypothetical protein [Verrucomicrobiota bacterium]
MSRPKQVCFWILLLAFVVLPCWWIFHFPFHPVLLCRIIPEEATAATCHIAPAERCLTLMDSAAVTNVAVALGADPAAVTAALERESTRRLVKMLGDRYVVTAWVPSLEGQDDPAVLFGAWIGGYSQLLRWGLADRYLSGFSSHSLPQNRRVWMRPCNDIKPGYTLSIATYEGVLVGCISSQPLGVLYALPRLHQQFPVSRLARGWDTRKAVDAVPDAFRVAETPFSAENPLTGVLRTVSEDSLLMEVDAASLRKVPEIACWLPSVDGNGLLAAGTPPLGDSPSLLLATPVSRIEPLLASAWSEHQELLRHWTGVQGLFRADGPVCVFASGGDYYGRIMGMRVPSFGIALPLAEGIAGDAAILSLLDALNAGGSWGLVATPDSRDSRIRVIESVRDGMLKRLKGSERLAIAIDNGWLIGGSNLAVLRKIVARDDEGITQPAWVSRLGPQGGVAAGWADLPTCSDLLDKALPGYTLFSLLAGGDAPPKRYDTPQVKAAIRVLGQFGDTTFSVFPDDTPSVIRAELSLPIEGVLGKVDDGVSFGGVLEAVDDGGKAR